MNHNILTKNKHVIDFLFPLILLFTFALCSMLVILFANTVYEEAVASAATTNNAKTAMAYITEKIHTGDKNGMIVIADQTTDSLPDGMTQALVISDTVNDRTYNTYIYLYDGAICELTASEDHSGSVSASAGNRILEIGSLTMEEVAEDLYSFSCTDTEGNSSTTIVAVRSSADEEGGSHE